MTKSQIFNLSKIIFSRTRRIASIVIKKLPFAVWGMWAVVGLLLTGMIFGYMGGSESQSNTDEVLNLKTENQNLLDLVNGYEDLSTLYHSQGENLSVVLDRDIQNNHPEEIYAAINSMQASKDKINIQTGRILELRRIAGLDSDAKSN